MLKRLSQHPAFPLFIIALAGFFYAFWIVASQYEPFASHDLVWYVDRGNQLGRGQAHDIYVYNLAYPVALQLTGLPGQTMLVTAMLLNAAAFAGLLMGAYLLANDLFNRRVAVLSVLLLACNVTLLEVTQWLHAFTLFWAGMVWLLFLYTWLMRRFTWREFIVFVLLLMVLPFVRFEAVIYNLLMPVLMLATWRREKSWRHARWMPGVLLINAVIIALYMMALSQFTAAQYTNSEDIPTLAGNTVATLLAGSAYFEGLAIRFADMLAVLVDFLPWLLWAVLLFVLVYRATRASLGLMSLLLLHSAFVFLTAPGSTAVYYAMALIYVLILLAFTLDSLAPAGAKWLAYGAVGMIILWSVPGILQLTEDTLFAFQAHPARDVAAGIDALLIAEDNPDAELYGWCSYPLVYSERNIHTIYRFGRIHDPARKDSPYNLLPYLYENDGYFLNCSIPVFEDWKAFLLGEGDPTFPYRLETVLERNGYTVSRVVYEE